MAYDGSEDRRTWTTLQNKCVDLLLKTTLAHREVRMDRDIYMDKHPALYIQNRDQTTNTVT